MYKITMKHSLAAIVFLCFLIVGTPVRGASLRIVTLDSPPLAYEERGVVVGYAADVVREALKRMGYETEIMIVPWARALLMTQQGEADAIFYAVRNDEREEWFHYPDEPLVTEATVPIKRTGENIKLAPDIYDYSLLNLGVGRGYYYGSALKEFLGRAHFHRIEEAPDIESNFKKLIEKRIDIALADLNLARYYISKHGIASGIEIINNEDGTPVILDSVKSYLAFSKKKTTQRLANHFSMTLHAMKHDGTYNRLMGEYR